MQNNRDVIDNVIIPASNLLIKPTFCTVHFAEGEEVMKCGTLLLSVIHSQRKYTSLFSGIYLRITSEILP